MNGWAIFNRPSGTKTPLAVGHCTVNAHRHTCLCHSCVSEWGALDIRIPCDWRFNTRQPATIPMHPLPQQNLCLADRQSDSAADGGHRECRRTAAVQPRHPADSVEQLFRVSRAGQRTTAKAGCGSMIASKRAAPRRIGAVAIVPGKPEASELVRRIFAADADEAMPPADSQKTLTAAQKELLKRWVAEGAAYEQHWAFLPPTRAEPPAVKRSSWPRNPVDRFILARLEREGLEPAPEADRFTLLRRLSLDLTGLPPAPADADSFDREMSAAEATMRSGGRRKTQRHRERRPIRCTRSGSTSCSTRRTTASGWRSTGSTPPAMPTSTATRSIAIARCMPGATG